MTKTSVWEDPRRLAEAAALIRRGLARQSARDVADRSGDERQPSTEDAA